MINQHNSLIGFLVYDAQRAIAKSLETALKPYEITPGQWNLINQLDSAGELSQKQLAERTRKEQATITRYLDTLERKGLVVRNQHKSDRRAHAISVTEKAHELVVTAQPVTVEAADRLIEGIDQAYTPGSAMPGSRCFSGTARFWGRRSGSPSPPIGFMSATAIGFTTASR